jgi:hypothetical protein
MLGLLAPTLIAVALSIVFGGSARALLDSRVRFWPVILATFVVEMVLYDPPVNGLALAVAVGPWIWLATKVVLLAVLISNAAVGSNVGWAIAAFGLALNTLVIGANGGHMPQSEDAAIAVWGASHLDPTRLQNVAALGPHTLLWALGDVLAEPTWLPRPNVISVGDVLLALGVAAWVFGASRPPVERRSRMLGEARAPIHGPARPTRRCST